MPNSTSFLREQVISNASSCRQKYSHHVSLFSTPTPPPMLYSPISRVLTLLTLVASAVASSTPGVAANQVLVVFDPKLVENPAEVAERFQFNKNYNVSTIAYTESDAEFFLGEEALYHHVVFLPSSKKLSGLKSIVNKHQLLEFFNKGGNVVAVSLDKYALPEEVRAFLGQTGIYPAPKAFVVDSHFDPVHVSSENVANQAIYPLLADVPYKGSAALLSNNPQLVPFISAPKLSFCADPREEVLTQEKTWTVGEQGFLAAGFQGLSNGRVAWFGSESLVTSDVLLWVFQERGVLKLQFVQHYKVLEPGNTNRTLYRVKDDVYYTVGVSEYADNKWVPYVPAEDDALQLSFKMLDPYQRLNLTLLGPGSSSEDGENDLSIFAVNFTLPDHHGMFTFELDYKRAGLSFLQDKRIVAVRHLANDEYRRSWEITNAWMYMSSAGLVVTAWVVFVALFMFVGPVKAGVTLKGNETRGKADKVEKIERVEKIEKVEKKEKTEKK